ncbi:MBOAT family O-acyltransferase [Telmatospirillum sp.]|uniref:MBOAT family O-acyltransferase n=1 Tax=Telmatospirillum sp. TaxID=2079197 RepID=UPI002841248A|nr:MBOAT family O-acyltransferase [Telmatospirillum sp.]MDR3439931.1 MBOAT family O-acyltransferase [Telmatospirillum sp.]
MLFSSFIFVFVFLPVSLAGYFLCGRYGRWGAGAWLVAASLFFYAWWNPAFLPLLLASVCINYGFSEAIGVFEKKKKLQSFLLYLSVFLNLYALFHFKYLFTVVEFFHLHGFPHFTMDPVILPLGISFFTFTQIGYLIDVKQGTAKDRGFLNYLLFVTFFPHLIAGPILHNREMMPQFAESSTYRFSLDNFSVGMTVFVIGLFKKTILADPLSADIAVGFSHPESLSLIASWDIIISYSLQLYFDFSGYSDMAIGLARMFNVRFPLNFDSPLKSQNVVEFWQRWHMTLTRYLNLYLYNPVSLAVVRWRAQRKLGTNRTAQATFGGFLSMIALPTFVTMILIGIWHGAGVQFLIFGLLHAIYITFNNAKRILGSRKTKEPTQILVRWAMVVRNVLLTYIAVLVGLIFFRSLSLDNAWTLLGGMIGLHGTTYTGGAGMTHLAWLVVLYFIVWALPNVQQIMGRYEPAAGKISRSSSLISLTWKANLRWAVGAGVIFAIAVLGMGGTSEFLYFQF